MANIDLALEASKTDKGFSTFFRVRVRGRVGVRVRFPGPCRVDTRALALSPPGQGDLCVGGRPFEIRCRGLK